MTPTLAPARASSFDLAQARATAAAVTRSRRALAILREAFDAAGQRVRAWLDTSRQRRELAQLDDRALQDIGIDRALALAEAAKPFWR